MFEYFPIFFFFGLVVLTEIDSENVFFFVHCLRRRSFTCSSPLIPFPVLRNYGLIVNTRNFFSCVDYLSYGTVALD